MKRLFIYLFIPAIIFCFAVSAQASQTIDQKLSKLESKVSRKFSKTYCNSTGFGISSDGALKFSIGETKGEFSKNPLIEEVNVNNIKTQILEDIADSCYDFDLTKADLNKLSFSYESK